MELDSLELRDLRTFVRVASSLSVTRAAEALGVRKSSVSRALTRLERAFGTELFDRSTSRLQLTQAGVTLQRRIIEWLSDLDSLAGDVHELQGRVRGELRVAAPVDLGALLVERVFAGFLEENPELRLTVLLSYDFAEFFESKLDVAIRVGRVHDERLVARKLGTLRRILVASPAWAKAHAVKKPADLARHPALLFSTEPAMRRWELTDGRDTTTVEVDGPLCAANFNALTAGARAGLGFTQLPSFVAAPLLAAKQLEHVLPEWHVPDLTIYVVYRAGSKAPRRVRALLERLDALVLER